MTEALRVPSKSISLSESSMMPSTIGTLASSTICMARRAQRWNSGVALVPLDARAGNTTVMMIVGRKIGNGHHAVGRRVPANNRVLCYERQEHASTCRDQEGRLPDKKWETSTEQRPE